MARDDLKRLRALLQGGKCVVCREPLPERTSLYDLVRFPIPKRRGGEYVLENVVAVHPQHHPCEDCPDCHQPQPESTKKYHAERGRES